MLDLTPNWNKSNVLISNSSLYSIYISFVSYTCFFSYGYFACSLGATLTEVAQLLHEDETSMGVLFAARGVGFMLGTFIYNFIQIRSKEYLISISVLLAGICSIIIIYTDSLIILIFIVFVQSILFCGIDLTCNILLTMTWGDKIQPYLQMLHFSWSFGGIVGPLMVGNVGYHMSNKILLCLCTIPMVLYMINLYHWKLTYLPSMYDPDSAFYENGRNVNHIWNRNCDSDSGKGLICNSVSNVVLRATDIESKGSLLKMEVSKIDNVKNYDVDAAECDDSVNISIRMEADTMKSEVSFILKIFFCLFYCFYVGIESGFRGWIASYINRNVPYEPYSVRSSVASGAVELELVESNVNNGRFLAIPLSTKYTPNTLMQAQLILALSGFVLLNNVDSWCSLLPITVYGGYMVSTVVIGLGISSIFPLGLTIVNDFNINMDAHFITLCMTGAVIGEAIIPMLIGQCMKYAAVGDEMFMKLVFVNTCVLISIYTILYSILKYNLFKSIHTK